MASTAKQIDALWSGLNNPDTGESYSGAIVGFFETGTATPKAVWYDKDKTSPTAAGVTQVTLSSNGVAEVYGDGIYKINIYSPEDTGLTTPLDGSVDGVSYLYEETSLKYFDLLTDLQAYTGSDGETVYLKGRSAEGDGGQGHFVFDSSDLSVEWTADTLQGVYVDGSGGGGANGAWVRQYDLHQISPLWFGADRTGGSPAQAAFEAAYDFTSGLSKWLRPEFRLPAGKFLLNSGLTWDGSINVIGEGSEKTVFLKNGNFTAITINGDQCKFSGFQVYTTTGAIIAGDTGDGIYVTIGNLSSFEDIHVEYQGGDGIFLNGATSSLFKRIVTRFNGGSGFVCDSAGGAVNNNANLYLHIDSLGNGDHGFYSANGDNDYSEGRMIVCQQNGKHGFYCESVGGVWSVYGEVNDQDGGGLGVGTYRDIYFGTSSVRNFYTVVSVTSAGAIFDNGTNNIELNIGSGANLAIPQINPRQIDANTTGRSLTIAAGQGGDGASANPGGALFLAGGEADGTGNTRGGHVYLRGGAPLGTGDPGNLYLQENDGISVFGSTGGTSDYALIDMVSTTKALIVTRMTTTQRDAMTPVNGMIIYNTTTTAFNFYENGSWVTK